MPGTRAHSIQVTAEQVVEQREHLRLRLLVEPFGSRIQLDVLPDDETRGEGRQALPCPVLNTDVGVLTVGLIEFCDEPFRQLGRRRFLVAV